MAITSLTRRSSGDLDDADTTDILEADDIAAELLGDADEPPTTAMRRPSRHPSHHPRSDYRALAPQPSAAILAAQLQEAETELTRLRRHMRARDAYLAELEQALHDSTSKLEASGIGSVEDAHKLFGRVRGQAFRIAELESELRSMEGRLARLTRLLPPGVSG